MARGLQRLPSKDTPEGFQSFSLKEQNQDSLGVLHVAEGIVMHVILHVLLDNRHLKFKENTASGFCFYSTTFLEDRSVPLSC